MLKGAIKSVLNEIVKFKPLLFNSGWTMAERIIKVFLNLAVGSILMSRYLSVEDYGIFNFALAFVTVTIPVVRFGVDNIITKRVVNHPESANKVFDTALGARLIMSVTAFVLGIMVYFFYFGTNNTSEYLSVLLAMVSMLFSYGETIMYYFYAKLNFKPVAIANLVGFIPAVAIRVLAVYFKLPVQVFAASIIIESVVITIILSISYKKATGYWLRPRLELKAIFEILKESAYLGLASWALFLYLKIDSILINQLMGNKQVGYYTVGSRITEIVNFIPLLLVQPFFTELTKLVDKNVKQYASVLRKMYLSLGAMAIGYVLIILLFSKPIVIALFSSKYIPSISILNIYIFSCIPLFIGYGIMRQLAAEGHYKMSFISSFAGLILNFLLNLVVIPKFGLEGAAWVTVSTYTFSNIVILFFSKSTRHIPIFIFGLIPFYLQKVLRLFSRKS